MTVLNLIHKIYVLPLLYPLIDNIINININFKVILKFKKYQKSLNNDFLIIRVPKQNNETFIKDS